MWCVLGVHWLESRRATLLRTLPAQKFSKLFEQLFAPIRSVHGKVGKESPGTSLFWQLSATIRAGVNAMEGFSPIYGICYSTWQSLAEEVCIFFFGKAQEI